MKEPSTFGQELRVARERRGVTQMDLALQAEVSARHISFLENGRASPSRQMVLMLASHLELPLAERNYWLVLCGFIPAYPEASRERDAAQLELALQVARASTSVPAFVIDRGWDVLGLNPCAEALTSSVEAELARYQPRPVRAYNNVLCWTFDPAGVQPFLANFDTYAIQVVHRVRGDAAIHEPARELLEELLGFGTYSRQRARELAAQELPAAVEIELELPSCVLRFFSVLTSLSGALDILHDKIRVELLVPRDDTTRAFLARAMSAPGP